jgi:hypothetical protein
LYPNPASSSIQINFNAASRRKIEVYTILGGQITAFVTDKSENELSVSNLENGVYFLRITEGENIQTEKLIIQK